MKTMGNLPPFKQSVVGSAYGEREILGEYCGLKALPRTFAVEWQHGWIWPEYNDHPEMVVGGDGRSRSRRENRYLVARQDQALALSSYEYSDVHAVGLPVVYLPRIEVNRKKGSLLIMPAHSMPERDENWNGQEYFEYLKQFKWKFDHIGICISRTCFDRGYWSALLQLADTVHIGAAYGDSNSLERMAVLLSSYEYVTTNDFGSHVPYASYFGAKVSVAGPRIDWRKVDCTKSVFYKNCSECAEIMVRVKTLELFENYSQLCVNPPDAITSYKWGAWQLGQECKRTPAEMRKLVGWSFKERLKSRLSPVRLIIEHTRRVVSYLQLFGPKGAKVYLKLRAARKKNNGITRLTIARHNLSIRNGTSDIEVCVQHFERRELLDITYPQRVSLIVDLGANIGVSVAVFRHLFPEAQITALEMNEANFRLLEESSSEDTKVTLVHGAIWNESGSVRSVDVGDGSWAFRVGDHVGTDLGDVPSYTFDDLCNRYGLGLIDVLKMDIEGAEKEVFAQSWKSIFSRTRLVIVEIHTWIESCQAAMNETLESATKQFNLEISRSGEFTLVRNLDIWNC